MKETEPFRDRLLALIKSNPGLHFRELQRRTGSAVGKLDYHLYQMERKGEIFSRSDGKTVRFFFSGSDTILERRIAFHMRNPQAREILMRAIADENGTMNIAANEKTKRILLPMEEDGILTAEFDVDRVAIALTDKSTVVMFLKKYRESFIDSIAFSIFRMLDEP